MEKEILEDVDNRREAAIASSASLRPNFKPRNGLTEAQLSKFRELHRRRLQIKAKSKVHKKSKPKAIVNTDEEPNRTIGDSSTSPISSKRVDDVSSVGEGNAAVNSTIKRRKKLYWGLDAKERWERKSNM